MAKSTIKKPVIILVILALIAVGAWFFIQKTATNRVEEEVQQFLVQHELQDRLSYAKLEASPSGTVTLHKVTLLDDEGELLLSADEVKLNRFKEEQDFQEVDFTIKNIVDVSGELFQEELNALFAEIDKPAPQHLDVASYYKLDGAAGEVTLKSSVLIPDFLEVGGMLNLANPAAVLDLSNYLAANPDVEEMTPELMSLLAKITLKDLSLELKDKGGVPSLMQLVEKQQLADEQATLTASEREQMVQMKLAQAKQECINTAGLAMVVDDLESACTKLFDFLSNQRSDIKFKASVVKPISVEEFMMLSLMGAMRPEQFFNEYQPSIVIE
ncbi:hypothetical protein HMPREF3144_06910 [Oligella sp. HMSC05A10]|uniref:hypothetical protein n=1 Tax=unclassified Oligella TaxID=2622760 RepID=UPI0008A36530|nr:MULTISPECIES: hypothetical protein [unclassified Oligella]OFS84421.1 hypothetical protein HMPREF3144_06910 [Oligella sp. HMSC05A10]OFV46125.1 hypothetical protein HMPREF3179_10475 [Oligella sp. HMSC09E12]